MNKEIVKYYVEGMRRYDEVHKDEGVFLKRLKVVIDELKELFNSRNIREVKEEFEDVVHTVGRLLGIRWICLLCKNTVEKHSSRYREYGCIRSKRNSCGKCKNKGGVI
jgi:hypothetical protein